ncbi:hypothetical protein [Pseudonocardia sp. HH130629-09]|uniref:hypothetical protein n=1 Tax=Pseudonocardia sp. HH130629-09 TaxID=1641402 RepID=UPI0006CB603E|nr:hypothetical protein [Pseudonocardia sp. HH130629-09]ALE84467.1 hypothetical protein XF36_16035 [Pseudonocardia sp. HH130629-09]
MFVTPGGIASHRYLRWSAEVVGIARIMHATDYPFNGPHDFDARAFLTEAPLSASDRALVASAPGTGSAPESGGGPTTRSGGRTVRALPPVVG